jgi:thermitase
MTPPSRHDTRRFARLALLACAAALALGGAADAAPQTGQGQRLTVVGYTSKLALLRALAASGGRLVRTIPRLHAAEIAAPPAALQTLEALRGIRYAERPVLRHELTEPGTAPAPVPGGAYEWQFAAARENLVPASIVHAAAALTVAVVDTGADVAAPDLAAKAPATWSVLGNSTDVSDYRGHGTFVSSLAAGSPDNGEGIAGFGGDAKLLVVQAANADGSITDVDEAAGIVYAVDHGARIINLSFGGTSSSTTEQNAINYAVAHGVLLVAAAGNNAASGDAPLYPAALLQPVGSNGQGGVGLAVGATTIDGTRASFSNYGSSISLAAPGQSVLSALSSNSDPTAWPRQPLPGSSAGLYGYGSGTSFAAPEVAGAAALVWAANPLLTASDVATILKSSASGAGSWNQDTGYGILDVAGAVARAQGLSVAPTTVTLNGSRSGAYVRLSWSSPTAVSYKLTVNRDGGPTQILLGATTSTAAGYDVDPGHTYTFTVTALDPYGFATVSSPYVASLSQSAATLSLQRAGTAGRTRTVRFSALLAPVNLALPRGGRTVVLESFDENGWRSLARARTSSTGIAVWTVKLRRGSYRIRARLVGSLDVAGTASRAVSLRVR